MIMIGGNSRNAGKTTLACRIISKLSAVHEVIALKVTSIRPGEENMHGAHSMEADSGYAIYEERNQLGHKDTSMMLKAGATEVYYVIADDIFIEKAILHFTSSYINNRLVVCESRSLRRVAIPGMFLMMIKEISGANAKDVTTYLENADEIFYHGKELNKINQFVENLRFEQGKFIKT